MKYWDIKPTKKAKKLTRFNEDTDELLDLIREEMKDWDNPFATLLPKVNIPKDDRACLHKNCRNCQGSGRDALGRTCLHMISCPRPSCSPTMIVSRNYTMVC